MMRVKDDTFSFDDAMSLPPLLQLDRFFEPMWVFASRLESLQRYFEFTSRYVATYVQQSRESLAAIARDINEDSVVSDVHGDITAFDAEYFGEFLRSSVLSHLFTSMETLLADVADDVAQTLGQPVTLPSKPMPYLNRYLAFLQQGCGLGISIDRETWRTIDALRELRNRYVHRLNRDLPAEIKKELQRLMDEARDGETEVNDVFVRAAFAVVGSLAKTIDDAYWVFVDAHESS